ncbi:homocysteine S-methyltransferase family protein, partial [Streptomyces sp. MBT58]
AWTGAGARLVGGCCRVGPDRIKELAGLLER